MKDSSIHGAKTAPPMPFKVKLAVWAISIFMTLITAVALMIIIDQVCPIGTDRPEEIGRCFHLTRGK